jgi:ABC-type nickel/cobalt efflux system permease component RcnA
MTTSPAPLALLGFAFVLGLRHALDVDHLAAVSTLVGRGRGLWRSALLGAAWGLGHTASLLTVAVGVVALHTEIPPVLAQGLELAVAAMLVALGVRLLATVLRGGALHAHVHTHGRGPHAHPHLHTGTRDDHDHVPGGRRSFVVGLVHGLAGSASLMLSVAASIPSPALALTYVAVFGAGSIGGMMAMSTLMGVPSLVTAARFRSADRWLCAGAAIASVLVGLNLAWEIGRDGGLLA